DEVVHGEHERHPGDAEQGQIDVSHRVEHRGAAPRKDARQLGESVERAASHPPGQLTRAPRAHPEHADAASLERPGHRVPIPADAGRRLVPQGRVEGNGELHGRRTLTHVLEPSRASWPSTSSSLTSASVTRPPGTRSSYARCSAGSATGATCTPGP